MLIQFLIITAIAHVVCALFLWAAVQKKESADSRKWLFAGLLFGGLAVIFYFFSNAKSERK